MKREYSISQYIDTIKQNDTFLRQYYFHSIIDLNLIKLDQILKYGILSKKNIEIKELVSFYMHSIYCGQCRNGQEYISLVDYDYLYKCRKHPSFSQLFEAFSLHTLTSLSLMIDRDIQVVKRGEEDGLFDDEILVNGFVKTDLIKALILPDHLTNKAISEISFLPGDQYCYSKNSINHLLDCIEKYFGKKIDRTRLLLSVNNAWEIAKKNKISITQAISTQRELYGIDMRDILSDILSELWQGKYGINDPTYIDIISKINKDRYPVYEIGEKKLRKII